MSEFQQFVLTVGSAVTNALSRRGARARPDQAVALPA
jgi:hypothetical protein